MSKNLFKVNALRKWWKMKYSNNDNFGEANVFQYYSYDDELRSKAGVGGIIQHKNITK
jgi:hypothetical protein